MRRWLYVANLTGGIHAREVTRLLKQYGRLVEVYVCGETRPSPYPSFAVATFGDDEGAVSAAAMLDGGAFLGRRLVARALHQYDPRPSTRDIWAPVSRWTPADDEAPKPGVSPSPVRREALRAITQVNERLLIRLLRDPELLKSDHITSRVFEEIVAEIWHGFGYSVELTKRTRDGGRDVIAVRSLYADERYLIECKRPITERRIDVRTVRELYGVTRHERATKGVLATTNYFSPEALAFVHDHRWELDARDFKGIQRWLRHYVDFAEAPVDRPP